MQKSKLLDVVCGNWVLGGFISLILVLTCALIVLLFVEHGFYETSGKEVERQMVDFYENSGSGDERTIRCQMYEADSILLINKNLLTGNEYLYLTPDCRKQVEQILNESSAAIVLFWLKSNYDVINYYEMNDMNTCDNLKLVQNYFSSTPEVKFLLKKEDITKKQIKSQIVSIR